MPDLEEQNKKDRRIAFWIEVIGTMLITGLVTAIQAGISSRNEEDARQSTRQYIHEEVSSQLPALLQQLLNAQPKL